MKPATLRAPAIKRARLRREIKWLEYDLGLCQDSIKYNPYKADIKILRSELVDLRLYLRSARAELKSLG